MKNSGFKSTGIIKHNSSPKQYVVVGVGRGGTSAIAASLHTLGVSLGDSFNPPNFEDTQMSKAFRARKWRNLKQLIKESESKYPKFAWKLPDSNKQLNRINRYFSNPYYIFVYRDIFAIANRKNLAKNNDILTTMQTSLASYSRIIKFIKKNKINALHISYEKLLQNKYEYAQELALFCNIPASDELLKKVSDIIEPSPDNYVSWAETSLQLTKLKQSGYDGYIDLISEESISGWMLQINNKEPITIELLINDNYQLEFKCDNFRQDLIDAKKSSTGNAGFSIPLKKGIINNNDTISIRIKGSNPCLSKRYFSD